MSLPGITDPWVLYHQSQTQSPSVKLTQLSCRHQMTQMDGTLVLGNVFLLADRRVVLMCPFELAPEGKYTWASPLSFQAYDFTHQDILKGNATKLLTAMTLHTIYCRHKQTSVAPLLHLWFLKLTATLRIILLFVLSQWFRWKIYALQTDTVPKQFG